MSMMSLPLPPDAPCDPSRPRPCRAQTPPRPRALLSLCAAILSVVLGIAPARSLGTEVPLNPASTYLHVCSDPALDAVPIVLGNLGIQPGDVILLEDLGGFDNGPGGDAPRITIGVLSATATLLPGTALARVPDAIEAGSDFITALTYYCGGQLTDIPQDFRIDSTMVVVPPSATHLFVCGHDQLYYDNSDPNGDYAVRITNIGATAVTPSATSTAHDLALLPGRPNPFRALVAIGYTLPRAAPVSVRILDPAGRHVRTLENSPLRVAGTFTSTWDGRNEEAQMVAAGVYLCVLESGSTRLSRRVVLVR